MFHLVNAGGWAFGDKLTSAQMNQLDSDHALALDRSVAGDTIQGPVNFSGIGQIIVNSTAAIEVTHAGGIAVLVGLGLESTAAGGVWATVAGGISTATAGGISPTVAGGINDGGVAQGIKATVALGITSSVAQGITTTAAGGISDGVAAGITVSQPGGLVVSPGSGQNGILIQSNNSWIGYQVPRSITRNIGLTPGAGAAGATFGTGWSSNASFPGALVGGATTTPFYVPINRMVDGSVNGSTLTGATLCFGVNDAHAGGIGSMQMPIINLYRQATGAGSTQGLVSLYAGGFQQITRPGSGSAWNASGNMQNFSTTPNLNNVVDLTAYEYFLYLEDENSTGSVAGNTYYSVKLTFTGITSSAPG